jgi:hypothetical protein
MFLLLLAAGSFAYSQNTNLVYAYNCVNRNSIDSAKIFIDKALQDTATHKDPVFWYVRGFIYKELYKKYEIATKKAVYRDTAVRDLFLSVQFDTSADNKKANYSTAKFLATSYYNDASDLLDSLHYVTGKIYYNKFRAIELKLDPASLTPFDVQFYTKLGDLYSYLFFHSFNEKQKRAFIDSAKIAYNSVLAISPNNVTANYELAILYYNQAVYIINETDYDEDLTKLNQVQDTSLRLAMQSLPFMEKTYQLDPLKKEAVKGLEGIYYLIHDTQKFHEYEDKLKELEGDSK